MTKGAPSRRRPPKAITRSSPAEGAGTRSGSTVASAESMQPVIRLIVAERAFTGAGERGLTRLPSGKVRRDRTEAAAIVRDRRVGDRPHGEAGSGEAARRHAVDGAARLRARAGEVEMDVAVVDRHRDLDAQPPVELDAVIVEVVDMAVGARRDLAQRRARHRLGAVDQEPEGAHQAVVAVFLRRLLQADAGDPAGGDLRVEIAHEDVRDAHVLAQDRSDHRVERRRPAPSGSRGMRKPSWKISVAFGRHRARRHAADVLVVGHGRGEREQAARARRPA